MSQLLRALVIGLVLCATGFALSDAEIETEITKAVSQFQGHPPVEWWHGLGERTPLVLRDMLKGTKSISRKIRLVESLRYFADRDTASTLKEIVNSTDNRSIRYAAIRSLSASQGVREKDFYKELLKHEDPQTRLDAARALSQTGDVEALSSLKTFLSEEKTTWVVNRLKADNTPKSADNNLVHIQPRH